MKNTPKLTAERLREVLHYDPETGVFTWKSSPRPGWAGKVAGSPNSDGYLQIKIGGVLHKSHRLAWLYAYGVWPEGEVDHKNRAKADNRLSNLRSASHALNMQNTPTYASSTSGHKGVTWCVSRGLWLARLTQGGKRLCLGYFTDTNDAIAARKAAEVKYHPFAPQEAACA